MKKIILIILTLLLTGCSDYKELNNLSYITGIGYDYIDNEYITTYEVMDNKKEGAAVVTNTYTVTGSGQTIYESVTNAAAKLNKTAYYSHAEVIILSERITNDKLLDVTDSIIRNPKLNEEFILVIAKENSIEEIFSTTTDAWPSVSFYIYSLIKDNEYSKNHYIDMPFAIFAEKLALDNIDPIVSEITIENDNIVLVGSILFDNYTTKDILNQNNSNLYNTLINNNLFYISSVVYDDNTIELSSMLDKVSIKVTTTDIYIDIIASSEIKKSGANINLYDNKNYDIIAKLAKDDLTKKTHSLITILQENKSDILGLSNYYYIQNKKDNKDLWTTANINISIDLSISRKGIIYNVN